jgi:hypothetical protein
MESSRREFLGGAAGATLISGRSQAAAAAAPRATSNLMRRRFGLNYVPSKA